jgi:hypothetical protein
VRKWKNGFDYCLLTIHYSLFCGEVAERLKARASKARIPLKGSRVQIPPSPSLPKGNGSERSRRTRKQPRTQNLVMNKQRGNAMQNDHLQKLRKLEPNNNINVIHKYLCDSTNEDLIEISKYIVDLYEIGESEREFEQRKKHGIGNETYKEYANYKKSFFKNPSPNKSENCLVELEYFLNLLYSISFSLYLSVKNYEDFKKSCSLFERSRTHLRQLEFCLNTFENLYVTLDTMSVLIFLVCGIEFKKDKKRGQKRPKNIYFSRIKNELNGSEFKRNFAVTQFDINRYPMDLLFACRNMRAHRPFFDWNDKGNMVSKLKNLSKVKSVCDRNKLFDKRVDDFVNDAFSMVTSLIKGGLDGVLKTYLDRLEAKVKCVQPHKIWEEFLS